MENETTPAFEASYAACYARHHKHITNFIRRYVFDRSLAEDLTHDVFVRVYEKRLHIEEGSQTSLNFLMTIARNLTIDYLRRKKSESEKYRLIQAEEVTLDKDFFSALDDCCIKGEVLSTLHDTINSFPEPQRSVFIQRNFFSEKKKSVTGMFGISSYIVSRIDEAVRNRIRHNLALYFEPGDN